MDRGKATPSFASIASEQASEQAFATAAASVEITADVEGEKHYVASEGEEETEANNADNAENSDNDEAIVD